MMKMNQEQHPLDQFLKEKLSERSIPYQDSYWEAASQMIGHKPSRRRGWLLWLISGLLMLPMGFLAWAEWTVFSDHSFLWADMDWNSDWEFPDSCIVGLQHSDVGLGAFSSPGDTTLLPGRSSDSGAGRISSQLLYEQLRRSSAIPSFSGSHSSKISDPVMPMRFRPRRLYPFLLAPEVPGETGDWKRHRHRLSVRIGSQLAPAWRGGIVSSPGFAPVIGVGYRYALTPAIRLRVGLMYHQRAGLNKDTAFTSVDFGFGRTERSIILENRSMHFASLPISAEFTLGSRTGVGLGIEPSYVVGIRTMVRQDNNTEMSPAGADEISWRYTQGYQRWDLALQAGMYHYLGQGLRVGTTASYGLRDLTSNTYFSQGLTDRQVNIRLWLSYDLPLHTTNKQ